MGTAGSILLILGVLFAFAFGLSVFMADFVVRGHRKTLEESWDWQCGHYDTGFFRTLKTQEYIVLGDDGYELHAVYCPNPVPSNRCVILSHGHTDTRMGSVKYLRLYLDLGFNCVIYDLRGHGRNRRAICTYGIRESRDLCRVMEDTKERFHPKTIGLHGESLGAAVTVTALRYRPKIDFAVADCGFADIKSLLYHLMDQQRFPHFLYGFAAFGSRLLYGADFSKMRPIDSLPDNTIPILFVHGASDSYIPPENSARMRAADKGYSELLLIPDAEHALSVLTHPVLYRGAVIAFLKNIQILPDSFTDPADPEAVAAAVYSCTM